MHQSGADDLRTGNWAKVGKGVKVQQQKKGLGRVSVYGSSRSNAWNQ